VQRGVSAEGRYVFIQADGHDPRLDPVASRHAAGAVDAIDGDQLLLRDAPGTQEVLAADAWLEGRRDVMDEVVRLLAGPKSEVILERLAEEVFGLTGAEGRLAKTRELASWLGQHPLELAAGLAATVGGLAGDCGQGGGVKNRLFDEPTFVFDPAGDKTHRSADRGLDEFGPFDSESFTPKRPLIAVVTPSFLKGTVETFISSFLNGVPGGSVFTQGFVRKYRLTACDVTFEAFSSGTRDARAYRDACLAVLAKARKPDLAFVITSEDQEDLTGDDSPYLVAKSTFMS
jgi:hypothetical protein